MTGVLSGLVHNRPRGRMFFSFVLDWENQAILNL